jgi:hypothetical protein
MAVTEHNGLLLNGIQNLRLLGVCELTLRTSLDECFPSRACIKNCLQPDLEALQLACKKGGGVLNFRFETFGGIKIF